MARSLAATLFLAASTEGRKTMLADRFLPLLDSDPELAAALMNALPSVKAKCAFVTLMEEFRPARKTCLTI